MDSQQSRKRKSAAVEAEHDTSAAATPTGSPARKRMKISQSQKQALIDNLQLEITERARHLRAHYALQASDLRSRIERRINRIPLSLRKANMGELLAKYADTTIAKQMPQAGDSTKALPAVPAAENHRPLPAIPRDLASSAAKPANSNGPTPVKAPRKRSSEIAILSDKENEPTVEADELSNPKNPKRTKTAAGTKPRAASRTKKTNAGNVLSPKSHNSRTLPRSPIKDMQPPPQSPSKPSYLARPTSPLKPASPLKTAASAATSAISASLHGMVEHARRGAGNAAAGLRRTASKEKAATAAVAASAHDKGKMAPPPRRAAAAAQQQQQQQQPERPLSQVSNHSAASNWTATSSATTVITKKTVGKGKTTLSATSTRKATGPMNTKSAAAKGAAAKAAGAPAKKVVVAEPAAGRRVLRKRN
ncbi:hypothetical protein EPUS_00404 [Endocarpon pusillum Z07020]|uniref:Borealin N-terminal domain-containing protein n=1 Tax=Endocarpon pusillum (strain Z07020 / HMAS-L-300199) TaxID=1263415 RepID=U1GER6_ENDPU|nr:uncharacterized protein EPUS_00404 [Endocarpon pusillum Z07020]ERF70216.1 hypothetical protein EPUS_00404 [Endocarpon pusillum Z07020]